jgi:protein-S-isoprenylcysteine O-methyltransferase Ste14
VNLNTKAWLRSPSSPNLLIALTLPFLVWRLVDEERMLAHELPGYSDYQQRVSQRIVPGVW